MLHFLLRPYAFPSNLPLCLFSFIDMFSCLTLVYFSFSFKQFSTLSPPLSCFLLPFYVDLFPPPALASFHSLYNCLVIVFYNFLFFVLYLPFIFVFIFSQIILPDFLYFYVTIFIFALFFFLWLFSVDSFCVRFHFFSSFAF